MLFYTGSGDERREGPAGAVTPGHGFGLHAVQPSSMRDASLFIAPESESYLGTHRWQKLCPPPEALGLCEVTADRQSPDSSVTPRQGFGWHTS